MKYTFGSSNTAAERLYEISKFFNPPAEELIKKYNSKHYKIGIDIGCGPGFTTEMLKRALGSEDVTGLDISDNFLSLAKTRCPDLKFIKHDITNPPFPVSAQTAYARFILSHMKNPVKLIDMWANELDNDGLLFVDEVEDIYTDTEVFKEYLKLNTELVASQGTDLFVGGIIAKGNYEYEVLCNETVKLPAPEYQAASWFYPNTVSIWAKDKFMKKRLNNKDRIRISEELKKIMESGKNDGNTFWIMRRIVLSKNIQTGL
jgi:trans-aconitate 2-methyltransferase